MVPPRRVNWLGNYPELWIRFQPAQSFTAFMDNVIIHDERDVFCPSVCGFKVLQQADEIVLGNTASPGTIPKRLERLRDALEVVFITKRLRPSMPRAVKISKTRYPVKRSAAPLK